MPGQSSEAASTRALYNQSQELEGLQRVFDGIDKNNDKKVDVDEMHDTIRRLGYKCSKKEVADMMWEARRRSQRWRSRTPRPAIDRLCAPRPQTQVDEDADGALEWSEFKLMCLCTISGPLVAGAAVEYLASTPVVCRYQRVRADKSGWEPRKLFTMIEFMMHDKDGSGTIDADECTQILYRRYSPAEVDAKVKEFMSHDTDGASMDAAEISFSEYVAMEKASLEELMKSHPTFRCAPCPRCSYTFALSMPRIASNCSHKPRLSPAHLPRPSAPPPSSLFPVNPRPASYSRGIVEDTRAEIRRAMKGTTRAH